MALFEISLVSGLFIILIAAAFWVSRKPSRENIERNAELAIKEIHDAERLSEKRPDEA